MSGSAGHDVTRLPLWAQRELADAIDQRDRLAEELRDALGAWRTWRDALETNMGHAAWAETMRPWQVALRETRE